MDESIIEMIVDADLIYYASFISLRHHHSVRVLADGTTTLD